MHLKDAKKECNKSEITLQFEGYQETMKLSLSLSLSLNQNQLNQNQLCQNQIVYC